MTPIRAAIRTDPPARAGALRRRLTRSLLGLTLAAAAILGVAYWAVESYVERESLSLLLSDELDHRLAANAPSDPGQPGDMVRFFRGAEQPPVPATIAALAPGAYDDIGLDGRSYRVLVRSVVRPDGNGAERIYLLNDVGPLAIRERELLLLLIVGVAAIGLLAWLASARLASLALAPLERLGRAVRLLDPARRDARLALEQDEELRGIGVAFNEHLAALDRMTERELAFAASVSHELRTHLAVVENTAEFMGLKAETAPDDLRRIERAARRARNDLDALLALTRPQSPVLGEVALEPMLRDVASEVIEASAGVPVIAWDIASAATVTTSAKTLAIVFSNLLRNAIVATGPEGRIVVRIEERGFRVTDDGPGLPEGDWARMFEPWFEGRNGGSGLGLFIAHSLMGRLGGRLQLVPVLPSGLSAIVEL